MVRLLSTAMLTLILMTLNAFADESDPLPSRNPSDKHSEELFVRRIWPLLSEKCLPCHGGNSDDGPPDPEKIKGGLDLRNQASAMKGGESGEPLIVAGSPSKSGLFLAVRRDSMEWSAMPPKDADRLTETQLNWMRDWIESGAVWPGRQRVAELTSTHGEEWAKDDGVIVSTSGGLSPDWSNRRYAPESLWAYRPVQKPTIHGTDGRVLTGAAAIDAMIDARLPAGLPPAPQATPQELIRRATFDLIGLPPTPDEIDDFEKAFAISSDQAIESLIDRLLASPHYGERMAQHWLDVTRYADSSGFANDYERGTAWRYRDYVIRSFNADKPYDQFVREQIAGDEMADQISNNEQIADRSELLVAAGFLRMGPWELTGMEVPKIARQRFLDDVTNSVGETFLAHSLQCARCHDHKFDPIPTRDYYSIQAVFATTQLADRPAEFLPSENIAGFDEKRYLELKRDDHLKVLEELDQVLLSNADRWFEERGKDPAQWKNAVEKAKLNPKARGRRPFSDVFNSARNLMARDGVDESEYPPKLVGFTPEQFGAERVARKGLERLAWQLERYEPIALSVYSGRTPTLKSVNSPLRVPENRNSDGELEQTCILPGGDPFAVGEQVTPGVITALGIDSAGAIPSSIEGRRLAFANWVAHRDNGLTTRAIANRIWMWHFNEALAGNPNNFGTTGKPPTHPELLDWLAATLVENNWSIKSLHHMIMESQTWRRSVHHPDPPLLKELDPQQSSYALFRTRRLTAEEIRDSMLSASGELNREIGGIPNRPEINSEAAFQPRQVMGTFAEAWVPNPKPEQRNRRSLYSLKLRGLADPAMEVFNAPSADFSCERRDVSTITPQVFAMFNSQASLSRAMAMASRVLSETSTDEQAIRRCFLLAFGRAPQPQELDQCLNHWRLMQREEHRVIYAKPARLRSIRRDAVEENTGERFSFEEQLHAAKDYIPDLQAADCDARTRGFANVCLVLFNSNEFIYVE